MSSHPSGPGRGWTVPLIEQAVGVLLGAEPGLARDAVAVLLEHDLLGDGLALHALVLASRKGTDPVSAIGLIAERGLTAGDSSDYERRAARAEAQEEAQDALADPQRCATALALVRDAGALRVAASWRRRLEAAAGAIVGGSVSASMTGVPRAAAGEQIACSEDYFDLLSAVR